MKACKLAHTIVGLLSLFGVVRTGSALGQFVPGHIFVSSPSLEYCTHPNYPDRIWHVDPQTGSVTVFAEFAGEECAYITGLSFTPDGCRLRAAAVGTSEIREFDADGKWVVVLNADDGISVPWGFNSLAYDRDGNFYVLNVGTRTILRFPSDGGPGLVFADQSDGISSRGPIDIAANGDLYYGDQSGSANFLLRIAPDGTSTVFEDYRNLNLPLSIATDNFGRIYVSLLTDDIFYYDGPNVSTKMLLFAGGDSVEDSILAMNPFDTALYLVSRIPRAVHRVNLPSGAITTIASIPATFFDGGFAAAVVVPADLLDANLDGEVNLPDWAIWFNCFAVGLTEPQCHAADFDRNRVLDLRDLAMFQLGFGRRFPACP